MGVHYTGGLSHRRRMVFVDGTNVLREWAKELDLKFRADNPPLSVFSGIKAMIEGKISSSSLTLIRKYWFGSFLGNEETSETLVRALRAQDFEPVLFHNQKGKQEKGVDIALTKEMLVNAFHHNCDEAWLIAGDEDYVELVKEVKRYGLVVNGCFFKNGLNPTLEMTFDHFYLLPQGTNPEHIAQWKETISKELNPRS